MKPLHTALVLSTLLTGLSAVAQSRQSAHRHGPHHLEGWTVSRSISGESTDDVYPVTLVLARHGHIIRRVSGDPFLWNWTFWKDGTQIAYQVGPLHFGMQCILADLSTGRRLAAIDCYSNPPETLPTWADALFHESDLPKE